MNDIDAMTYFTLIKARNLAFDLLEDDSVSIAQRLLKLLDLGVETQNQLGEYREGGDDIDFFDVFKNPEYNENIAAYFVYKYFLQGVYDNDVLSKVKMAVVGVLINTYFGENSWTIHLWSKETEHSQYNMDRYKKLLKTADCLSVESLKKRLNNI